MHAPNLIASEPRRCEDPRSIGCLEATSLTLRNLGRGQFTPSFLEARPGLPDFRALL